MSLATLTAPVETPPDEDFEAWLDDEVEQPCDNRFEFLPGLYRPCDRPAVWLTVCTCSSGDTCHGLVCDPCRVYLVNGALLCNHCNGTLSVRLIERIK